MSYIIETLGNLVQQTAFFGLSWGNYLMVVVALIFLYLAIKKDTNLCFLYRFPLVCFLSIFIRTSCFPLRIPAMVWVVYCITSIYWMNGVFYRP